MAIARGAAVPAVATGAAPSESAHAGASWDGGHTIAYRTYALLSQACGGALVHIHQLRAQKVAHVLHPGLTDGRRDTGFRHHLLQCADVILGAQGIAFGLHPVQPLGRTDQRVEFGQNRIGGMYGQLLGAGQLHLCLHLGVVHQRKLTKIHAAGIGLVWLGSRRTFGKNLQQGHGVGLDQRRLMLVQQAQGIAGQVAPGNVPQLRFLAGQCTARDLHQLRHEGFALAHRVDNAGTEYCPGTRRWLLHGRAMRGWREKSSRRYPTST